MNRITKKPVARTGYDFIPEEFLPEGKSEYHLRDLQQNHVREYRRLSYDEIIQLERNQNVSGNWEDVTVTNVFNASLIKNSSFYGKVRIGNLEPVALEFHNVCLPVGIYNSTIISSDLGDNVVIRNVRYLSHYIIGNEVIMLNLDEVHVSDHAKFGNGIIKEGEPENVRIWVEVCNENAGRKILPFNGMVSGDAFLWSRFRDDEELMDRFRVFTEARYDRQRGYYGKIGDRTVIKNTSIMKDVWIGTDAYIKGANKLKNLTIRSEAKAPTQIGEGCELVNGIIGLGCRIFYGVKAVRFVMASHSQLKYGARLINSFLGNNSTISCCEVLNSLIFPGHEQHHNNSFLCAALVMGQSNIAAGATIGSNHNSRSADGEMQAGRGFWPGLCVSMKHNTKLASFTLMAKGDYSYELDIPLPFSLISNDVSKNELVIMPGYWFLYNLYALARNAAKYKDRDKRINRLQCIEYEFLAPDSVNEIFTALEELKKWVGMLAPDHRLDDPSDLLINQEVFAEGYENSHRKVRLVKVKEAFRIYQQLIRYYGTINLFDFEVRHGLNDWSSLSKALPEQVSRNQWINVGGQLMPVTAIDELRKNIRDGVVDSWDEVHDFYQQTGKIYQEQKLGHAYASLLEILGRKDLDETLWQNLLKEAKDIKEWMVKAIFDSRSKDYQNHFRKMMYDSDEEMEKVIGKLDDNVFIKEQEAEFKTFTQQLEKFQGLAEKISS